MGLILGKNGTDRVITSSSLSFTANEAMSKVIGFWFLIHTCMYSSSTSEVMECERNSGADLELYGLGRKWMLQ